MSKEKYIKSLKIWVHYGFFLKRFGLGFTIDRYQISIDLGPLWLGLEWD